MDMDEKKQQPPEMVRYAYLKKKNKRIMISVHKHADDTLSVVVETIRLFGTWKDRHIRKSAVAYGIESFFVIHDISAMLLGDPLFMKLANREIGQMYKDKMNCITDIPH